jgi:hypothetical protein
MNNLSELDELSLSSSIFGFDSKPNFVLALESEVVFFTWRLEGVESRTFRSSQKMFRTAQTGHFFHRIWLI